MLPHINRGSDVAHNINFDRLIHLLFFEKISSLAVVVFGTSIFYWSHPGPPGPLRALDRPMFGCRAGARFVG